IMMIQVNYRFGSLVVQSAVHESEQCGANGLPVTPASIAMIGNFRSLVDGNNRLTRDTGLADKYMTRYLDCIRNKKERITIIFEHYNNDLPVHDMLAVATSALLALYHMHYEMGCVHGLITPDALVYDSHRSAVKLTHWALNAITESGRHCDAHMLIPNDIRFLPYEQLNGIATVRPSDVWSLALTLLSLMDKNLKLPDNPSELFQCLSSREVLIKLDANLTSLSTEWQQFMLSALDPKPANRATVKQLMKILNIPVPEPVCDQLDELVRYPKLDNKFTANESISIYEFYHLYCLAFPSNRDQSSQEKNNQKKPPILTLPTLVLREDKCQSGKTVHRKNFVKISANRQLKLLPIDSLVERLNQLPPETFCPLILTPGFNAVWSLQSLPIGIRENDFSYQCERIMIFKRLIDGSPFTRTQLISSAKVDIPPLYRCHTWAHILNVKWSDLLLYEQIDKLTATQTDRQISVDIPRCHQYNDLLASPQGHRKLTRVLKAWLRHNEAKGDVYWQGLDSLAAPFVILNFNNEPQAFACFNAFTHKYLKGFFQRDNSRVIQEYLALFSILIKFQDPVLANHLNGLQFMADLYAIPWFLTMFTHVLPLHQIMHLWDTLLLGNESFPLFIGLSILNQLRDQLLTFTFNDCILVFSDLPQIDINKCVKHAVRQFCATPKSTVQRGLWPLEQLKQDNCPLIDVTDVISFVKSDKSVKVLIIDCRSDEDIQLFGRIRDAVMAADYNTESVSSNRNNSYHITVVVNDVDKCVQLIANNTVRVCLMQLTGDIPNELLDQ
ncbi:TBC domain-containing protein kinase-like protein, partial [Oppia nitens]|uniref:TBC domain-containing protein kinase-like protein n=1 Tax=Oppia nitens TaxID=1686743 RepID=UPI0023DC9CD9